MVANSVLLLSLLVVAVAPHRGQPVGGLIEQSFSNPEVQKAVRFAIEAYNEATDILSYSREVKLIRAQTQAVEGVLYVLNMELALTECRKTLPSKDFKYCQILPGTVHLDCIFKVWSRPWLNKEELRSFNCKPIME